MWSKTQVYHQFLSENIILDNSEDEFGFKILIYLLYLFSSGSTFILTPKRRVHNLTTMNM